MAETSEWRPVEDLGSVETLGSADVSQIVSVLSEVFFDYPLMRFVLGTGHDYSANLGRLVEFLVMSRLLRDDVLLGVRGADGLDAVAVARYPEQDGSSSELSSIREDTWSRLGPDARDRFDLFRATRDSVTVDTPNLHLNMFGVRHTAQGHGYAEALMDAVHELSVFTPTSTGVTAITERESTLPLYASNGFEIVGAADVGAAFTAWGLYRANR